MRLYSTEESVKDLEPSVFAILETLIAVGICLWIGVKFGTWWHVVIVSALAPLAFLRTDESCRFGLNLYGYCYRYYDKVLDGFGIAPKSLSKALLSIGVLPISHILLVLASFGCRLIAAVAATVTNVSRQVLAIPTNFWRLTVATDVCASSELVPTPSDGTREPGTIYDEEKIRLYSVLD